MAYCCKVSMYVVLDAVQNESSYCCGALLECLSLSLSMFSQTIWADDFTIHLKAIFSRPAQRANPVHWSLPQSGYGNILPLSGWSVWPLLFRTHASHNSLEKQMEKLFVWKKQSAVYSTIPLKRQ